MVLKELIFSSFHLEGVVVFKDLFCNSFHLWGWCGGVERTDILQFPFGRVWWYSKPVL